MEIQWGGGIATSSPPSGHHPCIDDQIPAGPSVVRFSATSRHGAVRRAAWRLRLLAENSLLSFLSLFFLVFLSPPLPPRGPLARLWHCWQPNLNLGPPVGPVPLIDSPLSHRRSIAVCRQLGGPPLQTQPCQWSLCELVQKGKIAVQKRKLLTKHFFMQDLWRTFVHTLLVVNQRAAKTLFGRQPRFPPIPTSLWSWSSGLASLSS
ncbi:hypothetical protein BDZ88DRAFT_33548 [Geranomyces variabilis]|nr:hypothetical protein BDZ88DRAFT_33548 [Geranomyces variabilis]